MEVNHRITAFEAEALLKSGNSGINEQESCLSSPEIHLGLPMLASRPASQYGAFEEESPSDTKLSEIDTNWMTELHLLLKCCPTLMLTLTLQCSFSLITLWVAGRLGTNELGAASLANMTANVTGFCVYEGLAASLDTLTSQAYGADKKYLVGVHVQRMCVISLVVSIPIGAIWFCSPWFLVWLVPEKELAIMAGEYMRLCILGAPGWGVFEAGKRFTQAQGNFSASMWVAFVCTPIHALLSWWIVFQLEMGIQGAALALAIVYTLQPLLLLLYIMYLAPSTLECWPGIQWRRIFQNWGPVIRLSLPGVVTTLSEWLALEILTFAASFLGTSYLAAQSIIMTIVVFAYHAAPFPTTVACSVRFGNLIGCGALKAARTAWKIFYALFLCIGIVDLVALTSLQNVLASFFSKDPEVRRIIATVMPVVAASQVGDALLSISNGLLRGLGRQKISGWVNLGVYYVFAIPLSLVLAFGPPRMGLAGLWAGFCLGLALGALAMAACMGATNWEKAVEDARAREE